MNNFIKNFLIFLFFFNFTNFLLAGNDNFHEGKKLFDLKKYEDSKIKFEKDIVFNPKNENSYLYLAKIFNKKDNIELEENNLNTVIILNPKNEEAVYLLTVLNIKKSNFNKAKSLIDTFESICNSMCSSKDELLKKLEDSSK